MDSKEILEGNKLLADFDGIVIGVSLYSWRPGCQDPIREENLNYHESWGWMIPLLQKCKDYLVESEKVNKHSRGHVLYAKVNTALLALNLSKTRSAAIEFVKWANTQKQNQP